jgi:CRP-like cAMP-binding protein
MNEPTITKIIQINIPATEAVIKNLRALLRQTTPEVRAAIAELAEIDAQPLPRSQRLTPRDQQVVDAVKSGLYSTQAEIVQTLGLASFTVSRALKRARDRGLITRQECHNCFAAAS